MNLPKAPERYDAAVERQRNRVIEQADDRNLKRGSDVEVGTGRLILASPAGKRYAVAVSDAGRLLTQSAVDQTSPVQPNVVLSTVHFTAATTVTFADAGTPVPMVTCRDAVGNALVPQIVVAQSSPFRVTATFGAPTSGTLGVYSVLPL
jgi:hypothetical protein